MRWAKMKILKYFQKGTYLFCETKKLLLCASFVSEATFEDSLATMKRRKIVSDTMITKKPFIESVKVLERCKL